MPTIHNHKEWLKRFDPTKLAAVTNNPKVDFSDMLDETSDLFRSEAYSRQHKTYSNISILNGYKPSSYLYRYMTYRHFISYIRDNSLTFVSPVKWQDPFERRFLKTNYTRFKYTQPDIFCLCTTENGKENEDAAWRLYGSESDKTLRVKFNVDNLLKCLNDFSANSGCKIYIGKMNYEFSRNAIEQIHTERNKFYHDQFFFEPFTDENYLSLMCLKQNAYHYENEVRIFCCMPPTDRPENVLLNMPLDIKNVIEEVVIGPMCPFPVDDPRASCFDDFNNLDFKVYHDCLKELLPTTPILQSSINTIGQLDAV